MASERIQRRIERLLDEADDNLHCDSIGRHQVKDFLGEGGKKKVYLAHDTLLDREVAFALINDLLSVF